MYVILIFLFFGKFVIYFDLSELLTSWLLSSLCIFIYHLRLHKYFSMMSGF